MTTLGFHYFPDEAHYRRADLQAWLPELLALEAPARSPLIGSLTRAVPEAFVEGLLDAGIEPIVHIPAVPTKRDPKGVTAATLSGLFRTYARWGVCIRPRSLLRAQHARRLGPRRLGPGRPGRAFLDLAVPLMEAQYEAGLAPTFAALRAGGISTTGYGLPRRCPGRFTAAPENRIGAEPDLCRQLWTYNRPSTGARVACSAGPPPALTSLRPARKISAAFGASTGTTRSSALAWVPRGPSFAWPAARPSATKPTQLSRP